MWCFDVLFLESSISSCCVVLCYVVVSSVVLCFVELFWLAALIVCMC